ncbi:hypothetical protein NBRC110019_21660 [Neptunitalea chrysea]|uniref:Uncharacterized protein n=1 Tax=Neptunitalea chrysea TaxID=1647581 RepID=A0A9W6B5X5_9FLAO|nr:hypothetical protein [Neptunitalea chrysea]GLB53126.1 hypothetical protein NBRC110019_21660 [Neptunitalea chrysea]
MKKPLGLSDNEISIADAQERIGRYANNMEAIVRMFNDKYKDRPLPTNFVKAFWIPKKDIDGLYKLMDELQELKSDKEINGFRVYLGMDPDNKMTLTINTTEVAKDAEKKEYNKDVIISGLLETKEGSVGIDKTTTGIYDFIEPCPDDCDLTSILMEPYDVEGCKK